MCGTDIFDFIAMYMRLSIYLSFSDANQMPMQTFSCFQSLRE